MKLIILIVLIANHLYTSIECARILGVFPLAATSHYILANSLMKGLAEAGHDVTVISPFEEKDTPSKGSYRNVVLTGFSEYFNSVLQEINLFESNAQSLIENFVFRDLLLATTDSVLENENVQNFLKSDEKFDIVIVEQFSNDALKIFATHFNAPLILFSSLPPNTCVNDIAGNPSPLAYIPYTETDYPTNMTLVQKIGNVYITLLNLILDHIYSLPGHNKILKKYFPNPPHIYDLYYNASLILVNSHESLNQPVPLVPNIIQIGGFHVRPPKELPKELQDYLDNAKEGVIYFSLGSNLKSKDLPPQKRDALLKAFSKLKEKVLWKWEDDVLPEKPSNVKVGKWLPQQEILAHPNVKLFITHSGLLSTIETVYHGVPILAIPVFADQFINANDAVKAGYALSLPYRDPSFSEEKLSYLLNELLHKPRYTENVKRRSKIFHDRPLKPMENAVYWVEYVIRHNGAAHLRVAGVDLPWYEYMLLDVIIVVGFSSILVLILLYVVIKKLIQLNKSNNLKKQKLKKS